MLGEWPAAHGGPEAKKLFFNFLTMALCFSVNHGTVGALINLSTSLLGTGLGSVNLGTLWSMYVLTALTLATTIIGMFGAKGGLMAGTGGYCVYVFSFAIAAQVAATPPEAADLTAESCAAAGLAAPGPAPDSGNWCVYTPADNSTGSEHPDASCECQATSLVKTVSLLGAAFGGIAAGFLWTAQGAYFARNAELYAKAGGRIFGSDVSEEVTTARATGLFSSIFAALYLSFEVRCVACALLSLELALALATHARARARLCVRVLTHRGGAKVPSRRRRALTDLWLLPPAGACTGRDEAVIFAPAKADAAAVLRSRRRLLRGRPRAHPGAAAGHAAGAEAAPAEDRDRLLLARQLPPDPAPRADRDGLRLLGSDDERLGQRCGENWVVAPFFFLCVCVCD
jgi:hypothetical protein